MKIVVIGGSGLIGKQVVAKLRDEGHDVLPASPSSGVNSLTGEGLDKALAGAHVVIDVANSPSFEEKAVMEFFQKSGRNLMAAEKKAGVKHHVALSIVGTDRKPGNAYFRAKAAQEELITASGIPYTIVRATQFFEFAVGIAESGVVDGTIRLPHAMMQPVAASDVAATVASVAVAPPINGIVELAGPEPIPMDDLARKVLAAKGDKREVMTDPKAGYFGGAVDDRSLTPGKNPRIGRVRLAEWLSHSRA